MLLSPEVLVWGAPSAALLGYLRWGTESTAVTSYYFIVRSVPEIWSRFYEGLPEIGNARLLDAVYWICIGASIAGVLGAAVVRSRIRRW
ncbi:MAG: hypothetical protein R2848_16940 [Thermomicrobiales bacterium]